jgi:translation initiation factor 5
MESKMLTIPPGINDPSYRYKMPKMDLRQESRLNGVKTNLFNLEDLSSHLRTPPDALIKFLCSELGTNQVKGGLIQGKHTYDMMLKHLTKYIERYVICKKCRYPELVMSVEGKKELASKCNSCGSYHKHDSTHKAGKEIIKHLLKSGTNRVDIT